MPKFYCYKCGSGTDYLYNKPKVCLKCGIQFFEASVIKRPDNTKEITATLISQLKKEPLINNPVVIDDSEIEGEFEETPKITSFAEDIQVERNCNTLVLNQQNSGDATSKVERRRPRKASNKFTTKANVL